jgi:hypothetical protein
MCLSCRINQYFRNFFAVDLGSLPSVVIVLVITLLDSLLSSYLDRQDSDIHLHAFPRVQSSPPEGSRE